MVIVGLLYSDCNCLMFCGLFDSIIPALRLRQAPVYLNFSPRHPPLHSDLLSCHLLIVLLNNHSPAPLLLPQSIPLSFLPSPCTEPVSQPVYSIITSWTSPRFALQSPPLPLQHSPNSGRIFLSLPFCPSIEAPLQLIITGWGRNFIMTSEQPTHFLSCALIIKGTSWAR